jgi:hypothetical protein
MGTLETISKRDSLKSRISTREVEEDKTPKYWTLPDLRHQHGINNHGALS